MQVRIGGYSREGDAETDYVERQTADTIVHPRFQWRGRDQQVKTEFLDNDLALLRLDRPVTQYANGAPIKPIQLPALQGMRHHSGVCNTLAARHHVSHGGRAPVVF